MNLKKITDKSTISSLEIKDDFFVVSASKSSKLSSLSDFGKNLVNKDFSQTNTGQRLVILVKRECTVFVENLVYLMIMVKKD